MFYKVLSDRLDVPTVRLLTPSKTFWSSVHKTALINRTKGTTTAICIVSVSNFRIFFLKGTKILT